MGDSIRERVERGAALLDKHNPDWYMAVSLQGLRMSSCSECVLGQLYGDYGAGLDKVMPGHTLDTGDYGFMLTPEQLKEFAGWANETGRTAAWDELRSEWTRAIVIRRENRGKDQPVV